MSEVSESALDYLLIESVALMYGDVSCSDAEKELAYFKLENLGFKVGTAITEKITKERSRFLENLDVIKFICKDFWIQIFKKQIDNLKTNHRGVFVLTDNNFRWFSRMSSDAGSPETIKDAFPFLAFPCGLIRGALNSLGVDAVVIAEVSSIPQCTFQIKMAKTI